MTQTATLERLLRRDRAITVAGIALLCALAWAYVVAGAGMGMSAWQMTTLSLFPHQVSAPAMPMDHSTMDHGSMQMDHGSMKMPMDGAMPARWSVADWTLIVAMWWVMMIAMMIPSAAPTILLYSHVYRQAVAHGQSAGQLAPTGTFASGYLLVWLGFSLAAAVLQWLLVGRGLLSDMMMGSQSRWLSAGALIAAGLYQISPLKNACLAHCRAPAQFLSRHWRPGPFGALRLGVLHGAYCVGCCWMLMALLFVGGVMNLIWIAALSVLVLAEKAMPGGPWLGRVIGVLFMAWGATTLLV